MQREIDADIVEILGVKIFVSFPHKRTHRLPSYLNNFSQS